MARKATPAKQAAPRRSTTGMSEEHKAALAEGREQGRAVRRYLEALEHHRPKRGRRRSREMIERRLASVDEALAEADPVDRLHLIQERWTGGGNGGDGRHRRRPVRAGGGLRRRGRPLRRQAGHLVTRVAGRRRSALGAAARRHRQVAVEQRAPLLLSPALGGWGYRAPHRCRTRAASDGDVFDALLVHRPAHYVTVVTLGDRPEASIWSPTVLYDQGHAAQVRTSRTEWIRIHTRVGMGKGPPSRGVTRRVVPIGTPSKGWYEVITWAARAQAPKAVAV